jgi:acetolactate synthase-1/3 small subunit
MTKHTMVALVENQPGVLARIVGLISGRGFNIESLNVAPMPDPAFSRLTMTVPGDDRVLDQVTKQLNKLVDVIAVTDLTRRHYVNRELVLVEVAATADQRAGLGAMAARFDAKVVAESGESLTFMICAEQERVAEFLDMLKPLHILDLSRSGMVALSRVAQE